MSRVVEGSAAEKAGLRQGDRLEGYGIVQGDPDSQAHLDVVREGDRLEVRFFPRKELDYPVLKILDRERAGAFFRGEGW